MKSKYAPIVIFCYNRFDLLKKLLNSLKKNDNCRKHLAYFFIDKSNDENKTNKILKTINSFNVFKKKVVVLRKINYGLKKNILDGIKYVFNKHDSIIVLEDDLEVSKQFLVTINNLLFKYKKSKNIYSIAGYSFPKYLVRKADISKEFFLSKRPSSWGWATWKLKWKILNKIKNLDNLSNLKYGNDLEIMKIKQKKGILDSWAYNWTLQHIKHKKYCIYPKYSLVKNNGFDINATNNFFKNKKHFHKLKKYKFKNFLYEKENIKIRSIFKSYYDINILSFIIKYIFFNLHYEKSKKKMNFFLQYLK